MLERLTLPDTHAISILITDLDTVKEFFDQFQKAAKKMIAKAVEELKIHAIIEEKIFYPAVRQQAEADEEHHVERLLIAELDHRPGMPLTGQPSSRYSRKACGTTSRKKKTR
jgi:hemerythrin superfamily protein